MKIEKLLFAILLTPLTASCVPNPPIVELCSYNWTRDLFECSKQNVDRDLAPHDADKFLCLSPREFELRQNYINDLKKLAAKCN